jgi:hypothetical protein
VKTRRLQRWWAGPVVTAGMVTAWVGGCSGGGGSGAGDAPSNGLASLSRADAPASAMPRPPDPDAPYEPAGLAAAVERSVIDLESLFAAGASPTEAGASGALSPARVASAERGPRHEPAPVRPAEPDPEPLRSAWGEGWFDGVLGSVSRFTNDVLPRLVAAAAETSGARRARIEALGDELARLAQSLGEETGEPALGFAMLAGLEPVAPGALESALSRDAHLEAEDAAALRAIASALGAIEREGASRAAEHLAAAAESLSKSRPMRIAYATLCRRVAGFGQYESFSRDAFVAGRAQRMIVYVELDGFSHRPATMSDVASAGQGAAGSVAVEVSQALDLYREGESRPIWSRPEQTVLEVSRRPRRDFYLIHEIELPGSIAPGTYALKITMRDVATGALDQQVIPLRFVADALAAGAN